LEANFSCFAKIRWMPSWFAKLLELLITAKVIYHHVGITSICTSDEIASSS
jgi:hypothetical protein